MNGGTADSPRQDLATGWLPIAGLAALALVVRVAVVSAMPGAFVDDPDAYRAVARNLVDHGCFGYGDTPIASRPLLYPLVVAACLVAHPEGHVLLAAVHVLLGVATVLMAYLLALRWGLGRWAAAAAMLVAIDPILLAQSTLVMTETMATFLAVAGLLAATRCAQQPSAARAAAAGAIAALAVLCRPTFLVWMGPVAVMLPWFAPAWSDRAKLLAGFLLACFAVLGPWAARNAVHFGKATPATTHGGFTLLLANNPSFYEYLRTAEPGEVWDAADFNRRWADRSRSLCPGDEVAADRLAYADALTTIRAEPHMFAWSCMVRLGRTWALLPHRIGASESPRRWAARWAVAAFYLVEFLLAALGLVLLFRGRVGRGRVLSGWLWGLLLVAAFTAVHAFFWTNMRMRAPLVPVIAIATALGIERWLFAARLSIPSEQTRQGDPFQPD